ncbi:hypothetical protein C9439_03005 [archaeon SCG-AAA382B04]|nr:hypothetical protein C9439_03005 [archaeon SCG-AAA382B04]
MSLTDKEIEQFEKRYFDEIYFSMFEAENLMGKYLTSKDKIKDEWWQYFDRADKKTSDLARGAERVFFYLSPQDWRPNSAPIGSDLFFESHEAFIHIEVKTARISNTSDYGGEVPLGHNQTSYNPSRSYSGTDIDAEPHLPHYYELEGNKKPCLTYALQIIYDHKTYDIIDVILVSVPNGQLFDVYGNKIVKAGKTKNESFRYKFSKNPYFEKLDEDDFRVRFLYYNEDYEDELPKNDILNLEDEDLINHPDFDLEGSLDNFS